MSDNQTDTSKDVNTNTNASPTRRTIYAKIFDISDVTSKQASDIEVGIFNWTIDFCSEHNVILNWKNDKFANVYIDKARSVICNLDGDSYVHNTHLIERLTAGEFTARDLPFMSREQVFPERWGRVIERKVKRDSLVLNETPQAMTREFRCKRCSKRECIYFEKQTRSGDEAMSLFVSCIGCGNQWKIN